MTAGETKDTRKTFNAMLDKVRAEAKRDGVHSIDAVANEMDAIVEKARLSRSLPQFPAG